MHSVKSADRGHPQGKATGRMRIPMRSVPRVPTRRTITTVLLEAASTGQSRTTTMVQFIECTPMDEQHTSPHGCGMEQSTKLSRWRHASPLGKSPTRRSKKTTGATAGMEYYVLQLWMTRTFHLRLQAGKDKPHKSGARGRQLRME
jgi:hypothetical protein